MIAKASPATAGVVPVRAGQTSGVHTGYYHRRDLRSGVRSKRQRRSNVSHPADEKNEILARTNRTAEGRIDAGVFDGRVQQLQTRRLSSQLDKSQC